MCYDLSSVTRDERVGAFRQPARIDWEEAAWKSGAVWMCSGTAEVQTRLVPLLIGVYDDAELSLESGLDCHKLLLMFVSKFRNLYV